MNRCCLTHALLAGSLGFVPPVLAQAGSSGAQTRFMGDALARYEWTRDIPEASGETRDESRWRLQLRPGLELAAGPVELGVGAELNYSKDRNDEPPAGEDTLSLVRDNYRSRDARLDLAYGRLRLGPLHVEGGRFRMPLPLTGLVWDRDLRPQGGSASLVLGGDTSPTRLTFTGLYAKGSHVFEDQSVVRGGAVDLRLTNQKASSLQVVGSFLQFTELATLERSLRRQNTQLDGRFVHDYRVADVVVRAQSDAPLTVVADYCWNTALSSDNRGLWLAGMLGDLDTTRTRIEYTYARVDRDATVAAFNSDDFFWGTAWEGHRVDLGRASGARRSVHAIAQWQRPRDADGASGGWVKRWRLELRTSF